MEEGENDDNEWNAPAVILEIDSGVLNEIFLPKLHQKSTANFSSLY